MKEIITTSIDDINKIMRCLDAELIQSIKLEKGRFNSHTKYKKFNGICAIFYCNKFNKFEVEAICSSEFYTFYIPLNKEFNILNNIKTSDNMMFILPPKCEYQFFLKNTSSSFTIQIEKSIIENKLGKLKYQVLKIENNNILKDFIDLLIFTLHIKKSDLISLEESMVNIIKNIKIFLTSTSFKDNKKVQQFRKIVHYMNQNYKEDLAINEISDYFDISSRTMSNLFNDMIGSSPKKYLIANKMNKLKIEIENNTQNLTISKIMINNNLQFQSQICKDFKAFFNKLFFSFFQ